jgi:hypothetical protein
MTVPEKTSVRYEKAKTWIQDCVSNHEKCRNTDSPFLPRRVLDLRHFKTSGLVKLIDTKNYDIREKYACLSYCWGTNNDFLTTTENLAAMMANIPWTDLPQTYKDAIIVCSKLEISYLWIDALCIVQGRRGSPETFKDWEEQSAMMSSIYGQAYLTIAASNSSSAQEGFLEKCRFGKASLKFSYRPTNSELRTIVYGRLCFDHSGFRPNNMLFTSTPPSMFNALRSRAWCFQEHFLAARVLSFGRDEIVFDCNSDCSCECGEYRNGDYSSNDLNEGLKARNTLWVAANSRSDNLNCTWVQILREYTDRRITFPEDRLPAISGVARKFQQHRNFDYLAGHWDDAYFVASLTWRIRIPQPQQAHYRAPSWSWATNDGLLSRVMEWSSAFDTSSSDLITDFIIPENRLIGAQCLPATGDPTGAVLSGYIIVRGFCLQARLLWLESPHDGPHITRDTVIVPSLPWRIRLDRVVSWEEKDVVCWYIGRREGANVSSSGKAASIATFHELMILEKKVNKIYQRIGWLTLVEYMKDTDRGDDLRFLAGYEKCLTGFAIV